jgi:hypothetical protein
MPEGFVIPVIFDTHAIQEQTSSKENQKTKKKKLSPLPDQIHSKKLTPNLFN